MALRSGTTVTGWKDDTDRANYMVPIGKNVDKDIPKPLLIATVTETQKQQELQFKEDLACL